MSFLDVLHTYFRGEKLESYGFIVPIGVALLVFGVVLMKSSPSAYSWGAAVPAFGLGALLVVVGVVVGARTPSQVAGLSRGFEQEPAAMVQQELPRMQRVDATFRFTFGAFGIAAALGLGLVYGVRAEWAQGLGSVLILAGGLGLLIDGVAWRRAAPYTSALQSVAEEHGVSPQTGTEKSGR